MGKKTNLKNHSSNWNYSLWVWQLELMSSCRVELSTTGIHIVMIRSKINVALRRTVLYFTPKMHYYNHKTTIILSYHVQTFSSPNPLGDGNYILIKYCNQDSDHYPGDD